MGLQDEIREGKIELIRSELRGFESTPVSKEDKIKSEAKRASIRANAAKRREERKEADEKQAQFQKLKETLKKEGKL